MFGYRIIEIKELLGLSQKEFAEKINIPQNSSNHIVFL